MTRPVFPWEQTLEKLGTRVITRLSGKIETTACYTATWGIMISTTMGILTLGKYLVNNINNFNNIILILLPFSETFGGQIQNTFFKDALKWLAYRDAPFEESKQNPLFEALNA